MITKNDLQTLIFTRLKDADVLLLNSRYSAAVYLSGYAIELALKLKICNILFFEKGFPESDADFRNYTQSGVSKELINFVSIKLKDIKNHDLQKLLLLSGAEPIVKPVSSGEWNLIVNWNPNMRYKLNNISKKDAYNVIKAVKLLVKKVV